MFKSLRLSWTAENEAYILYWFNYRVIPAGILIEIQVHGYPNFYLEIIGQYL